MVNKLIIFFTYLISICWNEIYLLSFLCDIYNKFYEHMQWLSELKWDHNQLSLVAKFIFKTFLFLLYLRRTSNYLERIILSYITHMMSRANHVATSIKTLMINRYYSLEKEFTKVFPKWYYTYVSIRLIHVTVVGMIFWHERPKPSYGWMIFFIIIYESLAMGSPTRHLLDMA